MNRIIGEKHGAWICRTILITTASRVNFRLAFHPPPLPLPPLPPLPPPLWVPEDAEGWMRKKGGGWGGSSFWQFNDAIDAVEGAMATTGAEVTHRNWNQSKSEHSTIITRQSGQRVFAKTCHYDCSLLQLTFDPSIAFIISIYEE